MNFRVVKTETNDFVPESSKRVTKSIVWEGSDVRALSKQYPPSEIFGADDLGPASIEDGWIRWSHHFEREVDGKWVTCEDPRVRLESGLSDLEIAINEENRQLFPGDFDPDSDDDFTDEPIDDYD